MNTVIIRNDASGIPDRNTYSSIMEQLKSQRIIVENGLLTQEILDKVEYLHVENGMDLSGIGYCRNLKTLVVANTLISDISPVNQLDQLTCLSLACNKVEDLRPIAGMTRLQWLYLGRNKIVDITPLKELVNLERLALRGNEIVDITPLEGLKKITELSLEDNKISDISVLEYLVNLETLNISGNEINDVSSLESIHHMTYLYMGYNNIADLSPLVGMMNLIKLELEGNYITIDDVDKNLFQEFAMDSEWLEANGLEEESFETSIMNTLQGIKDKVGDRPVVKRQWNEDTLELVQDKKNLSVAIAGVVAVVGLLLLIFRRSDD